MAQLVFSNKLERNATLQLPQREMSYLRREKENHQINIIETVLQQCCKHYFHIQELFAGYSVNGKCIFFQRLQSYKKVIGEITPFFKFIHGTHRKNLVLDIEKMSVIKWFAEESFGLYSEFEIHIGEFMIMVNIIVDIM